MSKVRDQYEAFPYPERDPKDEKKRLITGSPSLPQEIDHFLFGGARDWQTPLRILVAGGGTGDALIQMTALLTQFGKPYQATYIDLSTASRKIAEARAKTRGLKNITFVTGSLLDAPQYGPFDYIDCCGVLHHLPDPDAGFQALREAVTPEGGMGFMVYAPYGRSGVYPLQEAFGALFQGLSPKDKLKAAQRVFEKLPDGHPFKSNPNMNDHKNGPAGFYDLLLHSQDRSYDVGTLLDTLDRTDWALSGFTVPALYDLSRLADRPEGMSDRDAMATAERLLGTIRTHTAYVHPADAERRPASGQNRNLVPHLKGVRANALAQAVAQGSKAKVGSDGLGGTLDLPKSSARLIAAIDGRRSLTQIATANGIDPISFGATWAKVEAQLLPWGMLVYSSVLR
jgi:SAM-dependent methyltransferase